MPSQDSSRSAELLLLGEIRGIVASLQEGQRANTVAISTIDGRLRTVEQKAAVAGALSGGVVSIGMALVVDMLRHVPKLFGG